MISDLLVTAPPGCGKTDFLARTARDFVRAELVAPPRRLLVVTFSNRARDNLGARFRTHLGVGYARYATVTNFHGFGLRLVRAHGYVVGRTAAHSRPAQRGSLKQIAAQVAALHDMKLTDLQYDVRWAKDGAYTDEEVLRRLAQRGRAAVAYEERLRKEGRLDFDDALRLGLLILRDPGVVDLYRQHFAGVLVDEVQDLSLSHFRLIEEIGRGRTIFAGDRAQGIYGFAGAAPEEVYELISARCSREERLHHSYRSAPAVLKLVSAIGQALGGDEVLAAPEVQWDGPGVVGVHRFASPSEETIWLVELLRSWQAEFPNESIGIIARARWRREFLDAAVHDRRLDASIWDYPAHRPRIVDLLQRHVDGALNEAGDGAAGLDELFLRCFADLPDDDIDTNDELLEAVEVIRQLCETESLKAVVSRVRQAVNPNEPTPPGIHLLNAHVGKGQQFDRVVVLGMEQGHIPSRHAKTKLDHEGEMAVLLVMVSRARHTLLFTCSAAQPKFGRLVPVPESRWLKSVEKYTTGNRSG